MAEFTNCSLCNDRFEEPKMLLCQHTYCLDCLWELNNNRRIICPECQVCHEVPLNGVRGFPNNLAIMRLLSSQDVPDDIMNWTCRDCRSGRIIQELCEHCDQYLCRVCMRDHIQLMIDETAIVAAQLKKIAPTIRKQLDEMTERERKDVLVETEIKQWEEERVEEIRFEARSWIAKVQSHSNICQYKEQAQCIATEIKSCQENFAMLEEASRISDIVQEKEKIESLIQRSKSFVNTMSKRPMRKIPRLKFELEKAEDFLMWIIRKGRLREITEAELQAEKQLKDLLPRRNILAKSLQRESQEQRRLRLKEVIEEYDKAIESCQAGRPVYIELLPSTPPTVSTVCAIS